MNSQYKICSSESIRVEHVDDLIADLDQALANVV
jgi:O-acetylhomoserine/O-acetylserine sulfhydrylase-like pyridoxal-dependent enzyme